MRRGLIIFIINETSSPSLLLWRQVFGILASVSLPKTKDNPKHRTGKSGRQITGSKKQITICSKLIMPDIDEEKMINLRAEKEASFYKFRTPRGRRNVRSQPHPVRLQPTVSLVRTADTRRLTIVISESARVLV